MKVAQSPRVIQPTWNKDVGIGQDFVGGRLKCLCWQYIRRRPATKEVDGAFLELIRWRFWGRHPEGREGSLVLKTSTWGNARSATIFKMSGEFATCKHWVSQRPKRYRQFTCSAQSRVPYWPSEAEDGSGPAKR